MYGSVSGYVWLISLFCTVPTYMHIKHGKVVETKDTHLVPKGVPVTSSIKREIEGRSSSAYVKKINKRERESDRESK